MKRNRVVFVIAHDREGVIGFDHRTDDFEDFPDRRASVDKIADEDGLPVRMSVSPTMPTVSHVGKQGSKFRSMAVNIANDVVTNCVIFQRTASRVAQSVVGSLVVTIRIE